MCGTIVRFVSKCGQFGTLLLASSLCYVAHFKCEQELNSICSRSDRAQHTRWFFDELLSNACLTFDPKKVSGIRPLPSVGRPSPSHCGEQTSIRSRDDGYSL